MTKSGPTVGVIGLGFGRAHIPAFQANGCQVVAVCQRDETSAGKVAARYGVPQVFPRWQDMLERAKPEIVVIATPPHLHHAIATRAFTGGAHVLCEKPLAMTRAEGQAMADAAARAGRVAMTCFNWRSPAAMQELNARVREGGVGRVFHLAGRWFGARWADESLAPTWRMDRAQAGHGAMGDMGVHMIDMIRWSFGEFARLSAHAGIAYPSRTVPGGGKGADAEDYCTVLAELASGAQVALTTSRVTRGANEHTLEVYGSAGALSYRLNRDLPRWFDGELRAATGGGSERVEPRAGSAGDVAGDPLEITGKATIGPLVARFLDAIRTGQPASPSFEDGVRAQAVLDAILESVARRAWVAVQG